MRMSQGVEWALHSAWILAVAPGGEPLSGQRLAEFYDLPAAYLAKILQSLVRDGVLAATSGPRGGYRLARPAEEITVLDVVDAVEGRGPLFPCAEIRCRGPVPVGEAGCRVPCGIARVLGNAEATWRAELGATSLADLTRAGGIGARRRLTGWLAQGSGPSARQRSARSSRN